MDITKSAKKLYTTKLINGETVNYIVVFSAVSLLLLVSKQAFKLIFGIGAGENHAPLHTAHYEYPDGLLEPTVNAFMAIVQGA